MMTVGAGSGAWRAGRPRAPRAIRSPDLLGAVALSIAVTALSLAGCSRQDGPDRKPGGPPAAAVPVTAATAARQDVPVTLKAIGSMEAYNTVLVRARVGGELTHVAFVEGRNVRQGDLLFTIDSRPFEAALEGALADSSRDSAKAASAEAEERRYADLVKKDYVTQQQAEDVKATARALRATVEADAAACRTARLNLSFCSIRAPISGRTGNLLVHEGNLVTANDPNPLVIIQQIVPIYVSFSMPEQQLAAIRQYAAAGTLRVEATASGDTARVHQGELTFINNAVDESTGTILLKATFPNADESLWPGQFVNVSLVLTTQRDAVVIPAPAIQRGQQGDFLYVIQPDLTVTMQPVVVGRRRDDMVVVESGLQAGDRVVTDGQLRLSPGAKVDIKPGLHLGGKAAGGKATE